MLNIDLNVRAGIDKSVLKDSERSIKDMLESAGKDGGANFQKLFETQLSKITGKGFADNVSKDFGRSGQRAGNDFGRELSRGVRSATADIKSQFDAAIQSSMGGFGRLGSGATGVLGGISTKSAVAAGGVLAIGAAAVTVGQQLYSAGQQWDEVVDGIAGKTGKVGGELEKLTAATKNVATTTASPMNDIADVVGSVSQATGMAGADLERISKQIADFKRVTGQSFDVRQAGRLFELFDVDDVNEQSAAIDRLAQASWATGQPVDNLVGATQRAGKAARSMGLDLGETAALIVTLEQAGLDFTRVESGLTIALKNFAKAGREPAEALRETIGQIKALSDAGQTAAASNLAQKTFGKGYIDFLSAIRDGKLDVDSLDKALQDNGTTIEELTNATSDWQEEWTKLSNTFTSVVEPAASATFSFMSGALEKLIEYGAIFGDTIDFWGKAWQGVATAIANNPIQMPQGPAVLGPTGTPVPTNQPAPGTNPLDIFAGQGGQKPGTTLDDLLGTTPAGPAPALPPPSNNLPSGMPAQQSFYSDWYDPQKIKEAAASGPGAQAPVVPYTGDPMSLLGGFSPTSSLYGAASSVLDSQHRRAEAEAKLNELQKSNEATAEQIQAARNELLQADQDTYAAELRLNEAKQAANEKQLSAMDDTTSALEGFSVELSRDMGISDGLGGILSSIVEFVASLAAAPLMGPLAAIASQKDPAYGSGLLGMAAAPFVTPSQSFTTAQGYAQQGSPVSMGFPFGVPGSGPMGTNAQIGFIDQIAERFGLDMTSGRRANAMTASGKSWHLSGEAGDFSNGSGNTPQMKAFAEYMSANFAPYIQELIYSAPGFNGNLLNGQPHQYSQSTLDDHRDHVHVAIKDQFKAMFQQMFGSQSDGMGDNYDMFGPGGTPWSADWNKMAQLEASGNWQANTGNGHFGGLQFLPSSWEAAGGTQYAPRADLATPYQQAMTGEQLLKMQGPGAWPNTFTPGSSGPQSPGMPQSGGPLQYATPDPYGSQGWQPDSSGGVGMGGLLQGALSAAISSAGAAGSGFGGQGAAMAAQLAMESLNRTIQFGSEIAGHIGSGIIETLSVGGESLEAGWLGRAASAISGAGASIGNVAGTTASEAMQPKRQTNPNDPNATAEQGGQKAANNGPQVYIENFTQAENRDGQQTARDLGYRAYSVGFR